MNLNAQPPLVTSPSVATHASVTAPSTAATLVTSALLLNLAGQRYSPKTSSTFEDEYDFIIVGAGSAGSVVASRLSEIPCVSVLLLEAGDAPPILTEVPVMGRTFMGTEVDWAYKTVPQKYAAYAHINQQVVWPSGKALGGSSIINSMMYVRGNHKNYDNWAAAGADGWSYRDVLKYFIKTEDNKNRTLFYSGYHGVGGPLTVHRPWYRSEVREPIVKAIHELGYSIIDSNGARQTGFYELQATMRGGRRCSTAKAYLVPAENRTNLSIVTNARVRKVLIEDHQAVGVEFDYMNQKHVVRVRKEVILSAGTINTAQILMLSGVGPKEELKKHNIPIIEDLPVGKNLQDHCATILLFEMNPTAVPTATEKLTSPESWAQYLASNSGPLASAELHHFTAFLKNDETHPAEDFPNHQLALGEGSAEVAVTAGITPVVYAKYFAPYTGKPVLVCTSAILQPKSRGTVTLKSANPYDPPLIDPNYYQHPQDVLDVVEGLKNCHQLGTTASMTQSLGTKPFTSPMPGCDNFDLFTDEYFACLARSLVFTLNHQTGTARMGDLNDPNTVVDPLLRVKNIRGLRVVDCSVMPIIPSGNTNVPVIMVGEKASDIIKSTIMECSIACP